jgi:type IV secretion system protein VirD4
LGIQLVTIFQDLAQAQAVYGPTRAPTILNNHKARLYLGGSADLTTLRHASGLIGDTEADRTSVSYDEDGRRSTTTELHRQALAPPDLLRRLPRNTGVLVYGGHPATRIRLRPWYQE